MVRILADPLIHLFIANKMISFVNFSYLSGIRGIHVTGALLGIENPWSQIAQSLSSVMKRIEKDGKNDRSIDGMTTLSIGPTGKRMRWMAHSKRSDAWAKQAVDTISHVCLVLTNSWLRMTELREQLQVSQAVEAL